LTTTVVMWYSTCMDKDNIAELQQLVHEKMTRFTTAVLHTEDGRCVHLEINLSFRKDTELEHAIRTLQKLNT